MFPPSHPRPRGLFFSFEGIDGSGKSTQARLLGEALRARGHRVTEVREPGGTPLGEAVRALLLSKTSDITPRAEALLFSAARAQLVASVIEPALANDKVVIADRYVDSTQAYQGAGRDLENGGAQLKAVSSFATWGIMPDRTYLVVVPLSTSEARRASREEDRMEATGSDFRRRVADSYERIAGCDPDRIMRIDGVRHPNVVHQEILEDALVQLSRIGR